MAMDMDVVQAKIGFLEGMLRAYSAPTEAFACLKWLSEQFDTAEELADVDRKVNALMRDDRKQPKKHSKPSSEEFESGPRKGIAVTEPYRGASEPGIGAPPPRREAGKWEGTDFGGDAPDVTDGRVNPAVQPLEAKPEKKRREWSPEARAAAADRMRMRQSLKYRPEAGLE